MRSAVVLLAILGCSSPSPHVQPTTPTPPAPLPSPPPAIVDDPQPTLRLPSTFTPTGYKAHLAIDPAQPTFAADIQIAGALARDARVIWLHGKHLTVTAATARDAANRTVALIVTPRAEDLLEVRAAAPLAAGAWTLALTYRGAIAHDENKGAFHVPYGTDDYVLTNFEPTDARAVFPSVDEPGNKVPWELTIDAPAAATVISNAPETAATKLDATHTRHAFAQTRPLPTYLVAFAVGPFDTLDAGATPSGIPVRIVTPHGTAPRAEYVRAMTPKLVTALEGWFGTRFPYPKLDVVIGPSYAFDAMEHPGAIFTDPIYAFVDAKNPSWGARHEVVMVIGHELAHQWFGDLVTPAWWDDLWLNESFATWFENKIPLLVNPVAFPDEGLPAGVRWGAVHADALVSAQRIREPIVQRAGIESAFNGITYNKGASLLRMIERYVGEEAFQRGVRAYLKAHADGSATAADLLGALEAAAGKPVTAVTAPFLDQAGVPAVTATLACAKGAAPSVAIAQQRFVPPGSTLPTGAATPHWKVPMCIAYPDRAGKRTETCTVVDDAAAPIALALPAGACPKWILPNAGGTGYFDTVLTAADAAALRDIAWPHLTGPERRVVFEDVRTQALAGAIPIAQLMAFVPKLLAAGDRFSIGDALGGIGRDGELADTTGLPFGLDAAIPPALQPKVKAWIRGQLATQVRALAFATAPSPTIEREVIAEAYTRAAIEAREPSLGPKATALAAHYRDLPASIRANVLRVAADADPALWKQLRAEVLTEQDHDLRIEKIVAVVGVHDPARERAALDLALDPAFQIGDMFALLFNAVGDEAARATADGWLRASWPAIAKRLPPAAEGNIGKYFSFIATSACDAARRDEIATYVTDTFGGIFGGERILRANIELMDQCIRKRAILAPSIEAWLAHAK